MLRRVPNVARRHEQTRQHGGRSPARRHLRYLRLIGRSRPPLPRWILGEHRSHEPEAWAAALPCCGWSSRVARSASGRGSRPVSNWGLRSMDDADLSGRQQVLVASGTRGIEEARQRARVAAADGTCAAKVNLGAAHPPMCRPPQARYEHAHSVATNTRVRTLCYTLRGVLWDNIGHRTAYRLLALDDSGLGKGVKRHSGVVGRAGDQCAERMSRIRRSLVLAQQVEEPLFDWRRPRSAVHDAPPGGELPRWPYGTTPHPCVVPGSICCRKASCRWAPVRSAAMRLAPTR